jgi:hypothetical protein
LEIKRENSKGENFMKSITLDYFFHYTVAWDHPGSTKKSLNFAQFALFSRGVVLKQFWTQRYH